MKHFKYWNPYWVYNLAGGLTEFYALVFTTFAIILAFRNELSLPFVGLVGAVQTLLTTLDCHNDNLQNNAVVPSSGGGVSEIKKGVDQ